MPANETDQPVITRTDFLAMQVCVPKDWDDEEVKRFADDRNYCGTQNGWIVRKQGNPALLGCDERVACADRPDYVHVTLGC